MQRTCTASHTRAGQMHHYALTDRWSAVAPSRRPIRWSASGAWKEGGEWVERVFVGRGRRQGCGEEEWCAGVCVCVMGSLSQGRPEIPQGWTLPCSNSMRFPNYLRTPPSKHITHTSPDLPERKMTGFRLELIIPSSVEEASECFDAHPGRYTECL